MKENAEATFVIKVMDRQNSTWQGKITWVEKSNEKYFRSALELLKMIDEAVNDSIEMKGGSYEE